MRLNVENIKEAVEPVAFEEDAGSFELLRALQADGICEFVAPVRGRVEVRGDGTVFDVEGTVSTRIKIACGRCLAETESVVESDVSATFVFEIADAQGDEDEDGIELQAEDLGVTLIEDGMIDLGPVVAEHIIMAVPVHPLCKETCRGVCPDCAADLNQGDCGCSPEPFPGKFAALKNFKVDKED